jgi:hypothetical protein
MCVCALQQQPGFFYFSIFLFFFVHHYTCTIAATSEAAASLWRISTAAILPSGMGVNEILSKSGSLRTS